MCGATGIEDVVTTTTKLFEKATLKLHCVFCGDTMFDIDAGQYLCVECNMRQEIVVRFCDKTGFEQFRDNILPEEVHIIHHFAGVIVNVSDNILEVLKK